MNLYAIDLFAGLGAWTIAGKSTGIETVQFVEKDDRCQAFLGRAWPGIPIHGDIKTFDAKQFRGIDIVFGGVPCQPASRAGKRKGASDDRWLWPEALRIVATSRD